jgi:carbamate kinase
MSRVVIALGGNALQDVNLPPTAEAQLHVIRQTAKHIVDIIQQGYDVTLTHGNGPQIGRIVLQNEAAQEITPSLPFDVCGAMSQGMIGYLLQLAVGDELWLRKMEPRVVTIVTQVVVDPADPAFAHPTKPIGAFRTRQEAEILQREKGYLMVEDAGRGYRRVVPSPKPVKIIEIDIIRDLLKIGLIVITVGGGGIPVIEEPDGTLSGIAAVIDKDLAAVKLAQEIDAHTLLILTSVCGVALHFGTPQERFLERMTAGEARQYMAEGHFAPGSMQPKIEAAIQFVESGPGRTTIVADLAQAVEALKGRAGTWITSESRAHPGAMHVR